MRFSSKSAGGFRWVLFESDLGRCKVLAGESELYLELREIAPKLNSNCWQLSLKL